MEKRVVWLLVLSVIAVAIFGFTAMGHAGCIASIASSVPCPKTESPLGETQLHIGMYKGFSLAVLAVMLIVELSLVVVRRLKACASARHEDVSLTRTNSFTTLTMITRGRQRMLAWLSTRERVDYNILAIAGA